MAHDLGRRGRFLSSWLFAGSPGYAASRLTGVMLSAVLLLAAGCGGSAIKGVPAGAIVGRPNLYDYSPSVIETGNTVRVWWCGLASNPNNSAQQSDTIQYSTIDLDTGQVSKPQTVMGETPGAWDSAYTCNPQVVGGAFVNPLGDGQTYTYAMYYVGTALHSGLGNSIGVAFSNDGLTWKKYPRPVIANAIAAAYGLGQPVPWNSDGNAAIQIFYESSIGADVRHFETASTDGVHFTTVGQLTTNGLRDPLASWGDMAFDSKTGYWYAAFNAALRPASMTGNTQERGQLGVVLYRIPAGSLLTGATPWQEMHTFDTNATGYESNFIAGFLRDSYGDLNIGPYPAIELLTSISNPRAAWDSAPAGVSGSAQPSSWDVGVDNWVPGQPLLPLDRYRNASVHLVTTGYVDPSGSFVLESRLGSLYEGPQNGANVALYACKNGKTDFFVSRDSDCEGGLVIGLEGYAYAAQPTAVDSTPLYRCQTSTGHFVSSDPKCEGQGTQQGLLGYAVAN